MVLGVVEEDIRARNQELAANIHQLDFAQVANIFKIGISFFK